MSKIIDLMKKHFDLKKNKDGTYSIKNDDDEFKISDLGDGKIVISEDKKGICVGDSLEEDIIKSPINIKNDSKNESNLNLFKIKKDDENRVGKSDLDPFNLNDNDPLRVRDDPNGMIFGKNEINKIISSKNKNKNKNKNIDPDDLNPFILKDEKGPGFSRGYDPDSDEYVPPGSNDKFFY